MAWTTPTTWVTLESFEEPSLGECLVEHVDNLCVVIAFTRDGVSQSVAVPRDLASVPGFVFGAYVSAVENAALNRRSPAYDEGADVAPLANDKSLHAWSARALSVCSKWIPTRIDNEQFGDALENIHRLAKEGYGSRRIVKELIAAAAFAAWTSLQEWRRKGAGRRAR
jgi:hypothetical protein